VVWGTALVPEGNRYITTEEPEGSFGEKKEKGLIFRSG